jgi:hypothetical protein
MEFDPTFEKPGRPWTAVPRGVSALLCRLLRERRLRPLDVAVLWSVLGYCSSRYGTVDRLSVRKVAQAIGSSTTSIQHSLRRLEDQFLLVRTRPRRSRGTSWTISPLIVTSGCRKDAQQHWLYWEAACKYAEPPPPPTAQQIASRVAIAPPPDAEG